MDTPKSLFYKTETGAVVGDVLMSVIRQAGLDGNPRLFHLQFK